MRQDTILDFSKGDWGEDRLYAGENFFFVIDGATPVSDRSYGSYHTGAEWMAEAMKQHLADLGSGEEEVPVLCKRFTTETERQVTEAFPDVQDMPCLTIAAVKQDANITRGYVLGDCSIYVLTRYSGITHLTDQRTAKFYQKTLRAKAEAEKNRGDVVGAIQAQKIKNKAAMNQPGGFWTVSYVGDYEAEFRIFQIPTEDIEAILLCTDGFDRVFFRGDVSPAFLLRGELPLEDALAHLRTWEKMSPTDIKQHDDAAAILLRAEWR